MLPSETMIWQPEFTDKTLSRKPGAVQTPISCLLPLAENLLQGLATRMIRNGLRGSRPAIL
ncbi:hypothetical protein CRD80_27420 [Escherichia coli]|nr:hypothetical protein CRD80_27420 [Escherichia coli]